jgi:hypothetical protein
MVRCMRRGILVLTVVVASAGAAHAGAVYPAGYEICGHRLATPIAVHAPPPDLPVKFRKWLSGGWTAALSELGHGTLDTVCVGLIVDDVQNDGTASVWQFYRDADGTAQPPHHGETLLGDGDAVTLADGSGTVPLWIWIGDQLTVSVVTPSRVLRGPVLPLR